MGILKYAHGARNLEDIRSFCNTETESGRCTTCGNSISIEPSAHPGEDRGSAKKKLFLIRGGATRDRDESVSVCICEECLKSVFEKKGMKVRCARCGRSHIVKGRLREIHGGVDLLSSMNIPGLEIFGAVVGACKECDEKEGFRRVTYSRIVDGMRHVK